jgi:hypothetical protein
MFFTKKTRDHLVKTTLARPSDSDVVLAADLYVGFSQNLVWHFFRKFVEHVWVSWKSVQGKTYSIFLKRLLMTFSAGNFYIVLRMRSEFHGNHFSEGHCNWEGIFGRANVNKTLTAYEFCENRLRKSFIYLCTCISIHNVHFHTRYDWNSV